MEKRLGIFSRITLRPIARSSNDKSPFSYRRSLAATFFFVQQTFSARVKKWLAQQRENAISECNFEKNSRGMILITLS
jgi:hypothetical protein